MQLADLHVEVDWRNARAAPVAETYLESSSSLHGYGEAQQRIVGGVETKAREELS
jgi:hypothetical protein